MSLVENIHVLHIVSGDLWAGAEVQLFTLAKAQHRQRGTQVSAVVLNQGRLAQQMRDSGIRVIVLDEAKMNALQILKGLCRTVKTLRPDIIHTHRSKENILGSTAARLTGNVPSLRTAHGAPEHKPRWYQVPKRVIGLLDWFSGRFLQRRIVAVSADLAGILQTEFPRRQIEIIENGIDLPALAANGAQAAGAEHARPAQLRVGIAGRLVPVKRVDLFIRAARSVLEDHPELPVVFYIFGDGPLRDELESLSRRLDTAGKIRFEGHVDDMHRHLHALDMLLMTSDHEGLPMVVLEAMALQVPIAAHATGGIPNLLDHGNCGMLVHDHSPQGYASAIVQLATNSERRAQITANAQERVTTRYSASANAEAYRKLYLSLLSDGA